MTHEEHLAEAERLQAWAATKLNGMNGTTMQHEEAMFALASIGVLLAQAQLHATLAVAKR